MYRTTDMGTLQKIRRTHERIAVVTGAAMVLAISSYFFTFSDLLDRGATGLVWFEIVSTVLFVFGLIFLKRLAFVIMRVVMNSKPEYRKALNGMSAADVEKLPHE